MLLMWMAFVTNNNRDFGMQACMWLGICRQDHEAYPCTRVLRTLSEKRHYRMYSNSTMASGMLACSNYHLTGLHIDMHVKQWLRAAAPCRGCQAQKDSRDCEPEHLCNREI